MFPLRLRSFYSLMRGTMSPAALCARAKHLGYGGLALTDRNNLYGLWPFLAACRREGLRPVVGCELDEPGSQRVVTCLVKNKLGYSHLCRLISRRHAAAEASLEEMLAGLGEGLVVLARDVALLDFCRRNDMDCAADLGGMPTQAARRCKRWAEDNGVNFVATPDCGIAGPEEAELYFLLRAIAENTSLSAIRERAGILPDFLDSPSGYAERFGIWPEALERTKELANRCTFAGPEFGLVMPPWNGGDPAITLRRWSYRGARRRYGDDLGEEVVDRLEHELRIIEEMGFSSYFLVVRDIVHRRGSDGKRHMRRICGRGSGAASLVAYCLEITNVCPIKFNLYFERFLHPGRSDPPDIDIDFAWDERDDVLAEVLGDHQGYAAMVSSHILFQPRMAVRETAKAYGIPEGEISRLTRKIPWMVPPGHDLAASLRDVPALRGESFDEPWPEIIGCAGRLLGFPRHLSVHPGGVVITPGRIDDFVPIEKASKGVPIVQWDKDGVEDAGLVKIDLLGNRSLAVVRDCLAAVKDQGIDLEETAWEPEDDPCTRETVARGKTMGCFYIESPAMRLLQQKAGEGDYEQLVIQSSIIRPAANEFVREYVRRLHGGEWQPLHPALKDVLEETFGLMVYQEDVSRVALHLAGFDHAKADGLRKVMSKKDKEHRLADYKEAFFSGCRNRNIEEDCTEAIWQMMMSFSGYSFCKPHSASYARVSFQAAYLKTYFPAEFMAAVLANGGGYYSSFAYVSEAKRCGIHVLPPDVNRSSRKWRGEKKEIRVGLQAVAGLSEQLIDRLCATRQEAGEFRSVADFFFRTRPAEDEARRLIHSGALDSLQRPVNRSRLLWEFSAYRRAQRLHGRMPLLAVNLPDPPPLSPPSPREMYRQEYATLGFLCRSHPIALMRGNGPRRIGANELKNRVGHRVLVLGWLISGKLVSTKTGEVMEFLTFEDEFDVYETTFFPETYRRYAPMLQSKKPYMLYGLVESDFGAVTLTVERLAPLKN